VIVMIAVPTFQSVIRNNKVTTETNALVSALQLARSEAVKRGVVVSVTATGASFSAGFCVHLGGVGSDCDANTRIREFGSLESDLTSGATGVAFNSLGELVGSTAVTVDLSPKNCPSGEVNSLRSIGVGLGGQVTVTRKDCV